MGVNLTHRQARLRREYASWYPTIQVTAWFPASMLARKVARQLLDGEPKGAPRWEPGARLLDDRHFTFRRGEGETRTAIRAGDDPPGVLVPLRERGSSTAMAGQALAKMARSPSR